MEMIFLEQKIYKFKENQLTNSRRTNLKHRRYLQITTYDVQEYYRVALVTENKESLGYCKRINNHPRQIKTSLSLLKLS